MSDLTLQQREFVNQYFVDFNGTRAAQRASYRGNENTLAATASRLLRNDKVKALIQKRFAARCMIADEALFRLSAQARAGVGEYIDEHGVINWQAVKSDGHLFKEIVHLKGQRSSFKMHDAQSALVHILRAHGAFIEKREVSGPDGGPIETKSDVTGINAGIAEIVALFDKARERSGAGDPASDNE